VEPCGGGASVLLRKPRSPIETYNDIDGEVVNFFRVLRDCPDDLIRKIKLTPWARAEYELSFVVCDDPMEAARRFFARSWMSLQGATDRGVTGWRIAKSPDNRRNASSDLVRIAGALDQISARLQMVQIENRDWVNVVQHYDSLGTLIYFDPPYVATERTMTRRYKYEWSNDQHHQAASILQECESYIVISGYACPLYTELYPEWKRVDKRTTTNSGGSRIESLWLSLSKETATTSEACYRYEHSHTA